MTLATDVIVFATGLLAGCMNAVAGGGSFVTVPTLIGLGIAPVTANMSSTIGLYPGSLTSAWAYRSAFKRVEGFSLPAIIGTTLVGGFVGAMILMHAPAASFDQILPWLLLTGSIVFALGPRLSAALSKYRIHPMSIYVVQFFLGIYGGYFGGAVGIMMLAAWSLFGLNDVRVANPVKVMLVSAANTVAVLCFALSGAIAWHATLVMLVAGVLGGYLGARLTLAVDSAKLRIIITTLNFTVTAIFFYLKFFKH